MTSLYWLSFVSAADVFLGAAIVEARDEIDALHKATELGLNPGGEAMIAKVPPIGIDEARAYRNRLMQRAELERVFGANTTHEERKELVKERRATINRPPASCP